MSGNEQSHCKRFIRWHVLEGWQVCFIPRRWWCYYLCYTRNIKFLSVKQSCDWWQAFISRLVTAAVKWAREVFLNFKFPARIYLLVSSGLSARESCWQRRWTSTACSWKQTRCSKSRQAAVSPDDALHDEEFEAHVLNLDVATLSWAMRDRPTWDRCRVPRGPSITDLKPARSWHSAVIHRELRRRFYVWRDVPPDSCLLWAPSLVVLFLLTSCLFVDSRTQTSPHCCRSDGPVAHFSWSTHSPQLHQHFSISLHVHHHHLH